MKRVIIAGAVAIGVFLACVLSIMVVVTIVTIRGQTYDASGIPYPQTAEQDRVMAHWLGQGIMVSAVVALAAGGLKWWRSGRPPTPLMPPAPDA